MVNHQLLSNSAVCSVSCLQLINTGVELFDQSTSTTPEMLHSVSLAINGENNWLSLREMFDVAIGSFALIRAEGLALIPRSVCYARVDPSANSPTQRSALPGLP